MNKSDKFGWFEKRFEMLAKDKEDTYRDIRLGCLMSDMEEVYNIHQFAPNNHVDVAIMDLYRQVSLLRNF